MIRAYLLYTWGGLHRYFGNLNNIPHEHERAVHYFTRAHDVNPAMREARLARAVILWRELDRIEEALRDLDALLQDDPTYGAALLNRALVYQQTGNYRRALHDLEDYLALPPDRDYRDLAERIEPLLRDLAQGNEPNN
ncbi:MAG: tetratricopeptide repeat protein [Chloroflexota bacterium]